MDKSFFYRRFYEQATIADENVSTEERVPVTLSMIPSSTRSVLDLGCGDGTLLHYMNSTLFKVGLDISYTILGLMTGEYRIQGTSGSLPFRDSAFDLILCTEVLEHLPVGEYKIILEEMQRVAEKYILISVPFREDLNRKQARCSKCGYVFHVHLHLRNFELSQLKGLFPEYLMKKYCFSGPREKDFPPWLLRIRRKYGHRWEWDRNAMCPQCGSKIGQRPKRTVVSVITSGLANLTGKTHPKWVSVFYEAKK